MTVGQLISKLQEFNPELEVTVNQGCHWVNCGILPFLVHQRQVCMWECDKGDKDPYFNYNKTSIESGAIAVQIVPRPSPAGC